MSYTVRRWPINNYLNRPNFPCGRYIGVDLHPSSATVTILDPQTRSCDQFDFPMNAAGLRSFQEQLRPGDQIALEATTNAHFLRRQLLGLVKEVVIANPAKMKAISQSPAKTDRNDSYQLAVLLLAGTLPTIWIPDEETRQDRAVLSHRAGLIRESTRLRNRVRSLLTAEGMSWPHSDIFSRDARRFLRKLHSQLTWDAQVRLTALLEQSDALQGTIRKLEAQVEVRAQKRAPQLGVLMTIPGIHSLTALTILAAIGTIDRFATPDSLANYAGMVPRMRSSCQRTRHGKVTKRGSRMLRWAVTQVVRHLVQQPGAFQNFYRRLLHKKNKGAAIVASGRKLLKVIWHMLRTGEAFRGTPVEKVIQKEAKREAKLREAQAYLEGQADRLTVTMSEHLADLMDLTSGIDRGGCPTPRPKVTVSSG